MCHRYNQKSNLHEVAETFGVTHIRSEFGSQKDLFPQYAVPVIRLDEDGERELVSCIWSLVPRWWKPNDKIATWKKYVRTYPTFNARAETIHEKASFRSAFKTQRALIPWTEFFEHDWYFSLGKQPISTFAGLWEWRVDHETGERMETCTIITTAANELLEQYHPRKRMPVILDNEDDRRHWLSPDIVERPALEHLFHPYEAEQMKHWRAEDA